MQDKKIITANNRGRRPWKKNEKEKSLKHVLQTIKSRLLSSREEDNVSIAAPVCQITRRNENKSLPQNALGVECGEPSAADVDLCGKSPHNFRLFKKGA